jgi:integrase
MAKKRGNNEGSIYKRQNGTWRAQVTIVGQRLSYSAKNKQDAQTWLRQMHDEIDDGLRYESTQLSLSEFMQNWLITVKPTLRHNTHGQYWQVTEQHILPVLGQFKLRELQAAQIQLLYNQLVKAGKGLRTVRYVHQVLHSSLEHAVKLGVIGRNPCKAAIPPKPKTKEMKFLDENQVQQFLIAAQTSHDRFYALYRQAVTTGMRMGELLGLKWEDLDKEQATLHIQRQLTRLHGIGLRLMPPKTKAATRRINLG